jgi:8-oxo-dGTP pyrophosphatase MutT (NUDIX family)
MRAYPLKWVFPGGHLDKNESLLDCLLREIKEEVGIDINHQGSSFVIFLRRTFKQRK